MTEGRVLIPALPLADPTPFSFPGTSLSQHHKPIGESNKSQTLLSRNRYTHVYYILHVTLVGFSDLLKPILRSLRHSKTSGSQTSEKPQTKGNSWDQIHSGLKEGSAHQTLTMVCSDWSTQVTWLMLALGGS